MELAEALHFQQQGHFDLAEQGYREIVQRDPANALAWHLLGMLLFETRRLNEALHCTLRSVDLNPSEAQFHSNLSAVLGIMQRYPEALQSAREAARLDPSSAKIQNNLGVTLEKLRRFDEAVDAYRRCTVLNPGDPQAHASLGNCLRKFGLYCDAINSLERAAEATPHPSVLKNLAAVLAEVGEQDRAIQVRRRLLKLEPTDYVSHGALLYSMLNAEHEPAAVYLESVNWARLHMSRIPKIATRQRQFRTSGRPFRVGYVSPDFREHAVARFIAPILRTHDRSSFEVFCYSTNPVRDATTLRLRSLTDYWREIANMPDDQAAGQILNDRIDVLVDLAGHTNRSSLRLFARQPAPVQVSYLGYPATTGIDAMQYRITDSLADPPGAEAFHTEKLIRLPRCAWCYEPSPTSPDIRRLPALENGFVTFAALHRPNKLTPRVLRLWARILESVPRSKLLLSVVTANPNDTCLLRRLSEHGIDVSRVEIVPRSSHDMYLNTYNGADIALDAVPYHGTTTTCDALWMGLPVVTLAGPAHVSRTGVSLLSAVGLQSLITRTEAAYVECAILLSTDLRSLANHRRSFRQEMEASPLHDAATLTAEMEAAYRHMLAQP